MQFDRDLQSPYRSLFLAIREFLLSFETVDETKKEKITTYSYNGSGLCHIRTMANGVDIGLLKGAFIRDKFGLLNGDSKRMRVLSLNMMQSAELGYYIREAMRQNE